MTLCKSALTIKVFGSCLPALGIGLVARPNLLLTPFQIPATTEVWIRVVGVLAFSIGIDNLVAAQAETGAAAAP